MPYRCHSVEKLINLASRFKHGRVPFLKGEKGYFTAWIHVCFADFFGFAFDCNHIYEEHFLEKE